MYIALGVQNILTQVSSDNQFVPFTFQNEILV